MKKFSGSLESTLNNLQSSSKEFSKFSSKMNDGKFGKALDSTMTNIQGATKGLNENMEAVKHNILLRGYFNKKKKADAKKEAALKKKNESVTPAVNAKDSIKQ